MWTKSNFVGSLVQKTGPVKNSKGVKDDVDHPENFFYQLELGDKRNSKKICRHILIIQHFLFLQKRIGGTREMVGIYAEALLACR